MSDGKEEPISVFSVFSVSRSRRQRPDVSTRCCPAVNPTVPRHHGRHRAAVKLVLDAQCGAPPPVDVHEMVLWVVSVRLSPWTVQRLRCRVPFWVDRSLACGRWLCSRAAVCPSAHPLAGWLCLWLVFGASPRRRQVENPRMLSLLVLWLWCGSFRHGSDSCRLVRVRHFQRP